MKEIKAFQCDYCDRYYKHKSSAKRHENKCFRNPARKACLTCGNFITDSEKMYTPCDINNPYDREEEYIHEFKYCNYEGKRFDAEMYNDRQKFQVNCKHWIPITEDMDELEDIKEDW